MVNADRDRSRGQLLLVAAVLIALVIVASAVLLNGLVTPESATTSSLSTDATTLDRQVHVTDQDLESLFEHSTSVDADGTPLPYAEDGDLETLVNDTYSPLVADDTANRTGALFEVEYDESESLEGHVVFNQTDGEFTNGTAANWEVAEGVDPLPRARFDVNQAFVSSPANAVTLEVDGSGSGTWEYAVTRENVEVGGVRMCEAAIDPTEDDLVRLDATKPSVRNATVEVIGSNETVLCSRSVDFGGDQDPPWTLTIHNGDQAVGTYVFTFVGNPNTDAMGGSDWPIHYDDRVINPAFDVRYVSEGIGYESSYRLLNESR